MTSPEVDLLGDTAAGALSCIRDAMPRIVPHSRSKVCGNAVPQTSPSAYADKSAVAAINVVGVLEAVCGGEREYRGRGSEKGKRRGERREERCGGLQHLCVCR